MNISLLDLPRHILRRITKYLDDKSLFKLSRFSINKDLMNIAFHEIEKRNYPRSLSSRLDIFYGTITIINPDGTLSSNDFNNIAAHSFPDKIIKLSRCVSDLIVLDTNNILHIVSFPLPLYEMTKKIILLAGSAVVTIDNKIYFSETTSYVPDFIVKDIVMTNCGSYLYILANDGKVHRLTNNYPYEITKDLFPDKKIKSVSVGHESLIYLTDEGNVYLEKYSRGSLIYSNESNPAIGIATSFNTVLILLHDKSVIGYQIVEGYIPGPILVPLCIPNVVQKYTICVKTSDELCAAVLMNGKIIRWNTKTGDIRPNKFNMF